MKGDTFIRRTISSRRENTQTCVNNVCAVGFEVEKASVTVFLSWFGVFLTSLLTFARQFSAFLKTFLKTISAKPSG